MASFSRADYERVFDFAKVVWVSTPDLSVEREAIVIMDMVEECIGQMPSRPERSRRK